MKKFFGSILAADRRTFLLLGVILSTAVFGFISFKAGAQQQDPVRNAAVGDEIPYQEFLYRGEPYRGSAPPVSIRGDVVKGGSHDAELEPVDVTPILVPDTFEPSQFRADGQFGGVNFQPAILGATSASNRAVVFPDPANAPATQNLVTGLPAGAQPHGVAYYGSDNALISDFLNARIHVVQISTAALLSTINTAPVGYDGTGTIAVAPNLTAALAIGSSNSLKVIQAPFGPGSAITSLTLPGVIAGYQTQAIVFNNAGRAFVYHTTGISVLDAPYTSVAFTISSSNFASGAVAITPDGNTLLATTLSGNQVSIFQAPFSAASTASVLTVPGGSSLDGIMVAPDGGHAIVVSATASHAASIAAPFSSSSVVETLPLPGGAGSFEDVGISADSQLAILAGNSTIVPAVLIKAPFTAAGATSAFVPLVGVANTARGNGAVRFIPPGLAPGLTVSKSAPATTGSGANLTYTINYANTGSVAATNVIIKDPIPAGTTFVSATDGGTVNAGSVVWNIGTVAAGANGSVSFTVTVNVASGGTVNNTGYTIEADSVAPIPGPPVSTDVTNSAPTINAVAVVRQEGTSGSATIANVSDAEDAENNLVVSVVGPSTVNGVTISGISVNAAGVVTATVAAACNASAASFTLQVVDTGTLSATSTLNVTVPFETTPPVITPKPNFVVTLPPNATSMQVNVGTISATDNCSAPQLSISPPFGFFFPVGTTTVTITATDARGNQSTSTFTVTVLYNFTGFTRRLSTPPPGTNFIVAGNAIPLGFSLSGFKGLNIFAAGSPSSRPVNCMTGLPTGPSVPTTAAIPLFYMFDEYIYYWQTNEAWAGTCREFAITLNDGSTKTANVRFYDPY